MNKFAKAGVAGVAALAIAAGGGTYALWSDYAVEEGNSVGADSLAITLADAPSGGNAFQFDDLRLAPGEKGDQENLITGRIGGAKINKAMAYLTVEDLADAENGCGSQTERDADDCDVAGSEGEFSRDAVVTINKAPVVDGKCGSSTTSLASGVSLRSIRNDKIAIGQLSDGEKACIKFVVALPSTAGDRVQTDSASFDVRYDLEQIPNA